MDEVGISKLLENLGLTEYEAKTLCSLFRIREAEAPEISRNAQVPKTRVYDVLDRLTKKGLVIEIYGRPKKYRVVDASDAIEHLIEKKKQEIQKLEEKAQNLKQFISGWQSIPSEEKEKVLKVKEKIDFEKILAQEIDKAKNELIAFTEITAAQNALRDSIKRAGKKKLNVRVVGRAPKKLRNLMQEFMEHGVSLKHCEHGLNAFVIDKKNVILALSDFSKEKPEYYFSIWHDNPHLAKMFYSYFEECWGKAKNI